LLLPILNKEAEDDSVVVIDTENCVDDYVSIKDISENIRAATHEFKVQDPDDIQLIKCFILAFFKYINKIKDKSTLDRGSVANYGRYFQQQMDLLLY